MFGTYLPLTRLFRPLRQLGVVTLALVLAALSAPSVQADSEDDGAAGRTLDCSPYVLDGQSVLDPSLYLELTLDGEPVFQPGWDDGDASSPDRYWVLPSRGSLEIDFDRDAMRCLWDSSTSAELTVSAGVTDTNGKSRKVEVQGYSTIGEELKVVGLDLTAARRILDHLYQASRFAHRLRGFEDRAELAGQIARADAIRSELEAYVEFVVDLERQLRGVYASATAFRLGADDLEDISEAVQGARARLEQARRRDAAQAAMVRSTFQAALSVERPGLEAWLQDLASKDTAAYFEVLSELAGRSPALIRAVAEDISEAVKTLSDAESTPAEIDAARRRVVGQASKVLEIESDLYHRLQDHPRPDSIRSRETFLRHRPASFELAALRPPEALLRDEVKEKRSSEDLWKFRHQARSLARLAREESPEADEVNRYLRVFSPGVCPEIAQREDLGDLEDVRNDLVEQRLDSIESLLKGLKASDDRRSEIKVRFESQVAASFESYGNLQRELVALEASIAQRQLDLCALKLVTESDEFQQKIDRMADGLRAALLVEVIDALVARVPTAQLDLAGLGLQRGDRFDLHVSLLPIPPGQTVVRQNTYSFDIHPRGWRAPGPLRITDTLSFAKAEGGDFEPRPGATAVWNFYGDGRRTGSFMRTLAPGLGITATFLDFDDGGDGGGGEGGEGSGGDGESIEVGLGVSVTLFDNLVSVTFGKNLMAEQDGSRDYWAIGFSVLESLDRFKSYLE